MCKVCEAIGLAAQEPRTLATNGYVKMLMDRLAGIADDLGWDQRPVLVVLSTVGPQPTDDPQITRFGLESTPLSVFDAFVDANEGSVQHALRDLRDLYFLKPARIPSTVVGVVLISEVYERYVPDGAPRPTMEPSKDPTSIERRFTWFMGADDSQSHIVQDRGQNERTFIAEGPGTGEMLDRLRDVLYMLIGG